MHSPNWDDLRFVLSVARTGSVSAAARELGVNHATVLRRISAFEETTGGQMFERSAQGYRLRPDRAAVIEAAREAETAMQSVTRLMAGGASGKGSVLRLTSTDTLCQTVLSEAMPRIARRIAPDHVALICANHHLDMARLQADVTLRPATSLAADMVGEQVVDMGFAVYAAASAPGTWLGLTGTLAQSLPGRWMAHHIAPEQINGQADSFCVLAKLAQAGMGMAILPCVLGDSLSGVARCSGTGMPPTSVPLWVACHADLEDNPRILGLRRALASSLRRMAPQLKGEAA
ncbi:LysR family transcriptional regulator [Pseudoprimorskyibacter insulae]|uniref:HTH-type transcriptional regulator TfdS n=1 Tax=Pseudoprimorskyibacter insulae TaxID=1695997 RepID=A0A2R8AWL7_9RHOB|nr:LysR family transcriptional regulator [Pseudoprimorskyibacter insulae]SPF80423.1 HTH-type transcriptional regulator TfdS [Pseudoprimorskyibacter insulae]